MPIFNTEVPFWRDHWCRSGAKSWRHRVTGGGWLALNCAAAIAPRLICGEPLLPRGRHLCLACALMILITDDLTRSGQPAAPHFMPIVRPCGGAPLIDTPWERS